MPQVIITLPLSLMNINHTLMWPEIWAETGGMISIAGLAPLFRYTPLRCVHFEICTLVWILINFES